LNQPRLTWGDIGGAEFVRLQRAGRRLWLFDIRNDQVQFVVLYDHFVPVESCIGIDEQLARCNVVLKPVPRTGERIAFEYAGRDRSPAMQTRIPQRVPFALVMEDADGERTHVNDLPVSLCDIGNFGDKDGLVRDRLVLVMLMFKSFRREVIYRVLIDLNKSIERLRFTLGAIRARQHFEDHHH
jgi:hypothetical protein